MNADKTPVQYWQCPQNPEHVFDIDDWRVLPTETVNQWRGTIAHCAFDRRELERRRMEVGR
jgi:hypothetical protein